MKTIEIVISPQGAILLQTKGFAGNTCKAATKALEEALGIKGKEKLTAEFYQTQTAHSQERLRQ